MNEFFANSLYAGVVLSFISFAIGKYLNKKLKSPLINPLLVAIIIVILFLKLSNVSYENYNLSAKYLSYLIGPATVSLAVPLYQKLEILKKNYKAVAISLIVGVFASLVSVILFSIIFKLERDIMITLLPKSVTTAIGVDIAEEFGGYGSLTAAIIIITGVFGYIVAESLFKIFKIKHPISKGLAIGVSSHVMGTAKAVELGELEAAMSSLAIVICGVLTIIGVNILVQII